MENKDNENVSLKTMLVKYLRRWKLFLLVFILSFIPAILYLKLYPRTFEFTAGILLQKDKESGIGGLGVGEAAGMMKSFGLGGLGDISINVEDEMEILASKRLLRMMILELGINVIYSEPFSLYKMYREAPLQLTADSATMTNLQDEYRFTVSVMPGQTKVNVKTYLSKLNRTFTYASLPARVQIDGDEFLIDYDNDGSQKSAFKLKIRVVPAGWMAETLGKKIEIEEVSNASNVLTLSYSDHVKRRGLDVMNTLIRVYNDDMKSYKLVQDDKTMAFVNSRISDVLIELDKVEAGLQDFKKKNDMTLLETDVTLYSEMFKDIRTAVTEAEMNVYSVDLLDNYISNPDNYYKTIPSVFLVDEGEKGVITSYNKAVVNSEKLLMNSNEKNYIYLQARRDVELLRESVQAMITNARKSVSKTLDDLKSQEKELLSKFRSVPEKEREYVVFERDREILHGIYLLMLQKREETIISLAKQTDRARVIETPYIKKKPLGPRKLYAGIGILVLTLVIPVGYLFTRELFISLREEMKTG